MYGAKRPFLKPTLFILILAAFVLTACGTGQAQTQNWPGMSAAGDTVYVAHGPAVLAFDVVNQAALWSFPTVDERGTLQFYAPPSVLEGRVILGDYGIATSMFNPRQIVSIYGLSDPPGAPSDWINADVATDKIIAPPLQVGDRVFVATADGQLLALDSATGELLWDQPFSAEYGFWGSLAFADGVVYAADLDGNVYGVEAESGVENGRWKTDASFPGGLTLDGDTIFAGGLDNRVRALDRTSPGSELWMFEAANGVWGAPTAVDEFVFFGDMTGNVYAVAGDTGALLWQQAVSGPIVTSPVVVDGVLYIASEGDPENRTPTWQLTAFNSADGAQLWQQSPPAGIYTTPVVVGDLVVGVMHGAGNGDLLIAYDITTGVQQWTYAPEN
ncbi:MAG: PQQ-binding-like beta-propeller repeat protein [Chloroflexota bacterium]